MSNKCYLCGNLMLSKDSNADCVCHNEHIIPNAIGGRLTSSKILCKKCGSNYGDHEDQAFINLFSCFIYLIEDIMHFDRTHKGVIAQAYDYNSDGQEIVNINHEEAYPKKPYHFINEKDKIITVFGHKTTTKHYIKQFEKQEKNGYKINVINNLNGLFGVFFSEGNDCFNDDFKKGFVKIAIEFALHCGVNRENLNLSLKINSDGRAKVLYDSILVFPYIPCNNPLAILFEEHRLDLEKGYPSHSLRLFNIEHYLYCYVGLFSTFQYYVLLSDQYNEESIDMCYYQSVLRDEQHTKHYYAHEELRQLDMSDLDILIRELKVDIKGKSLEDIYMQIEEKQRISSSCDFRSVIDNSFKTIINIVNQSFNSVEIEEDDVVDDIVDSAKQMMDDFNMNKEEYLNFINCNNDFDKYLKYNVLLDDGEEVLDDCVIRSNERMANSLDYARRYTNKKFELLQRFCNTHKQEIVWKKLIENMNRNSKNYI